MTDPVLCGGCGAQFEPQLAEGELDPYALLEWAPPGWLLILPAGPNLCPACNPWHVG